MKDFSRESRLCALGRFAYAQMVNTPARLHSPLVKIEDEQIPVDWDEALQAAAKKLQGYQGNEVAVFLNECETRETRYLYEKFAMEVLGAEPTYVPFDEGISQAVKERIWSGGLKAAVVTGNYLDDKTTLVPY